ncbi:MAG: hypothetical protein KDC95_06940 [Planctomycetes bacterium]|nr:hypothetical protein [Planctomycetota bacterium]
MATFLVHCLVTLGIAGSIAANGSSTSPDREATRVTVKGDVELSPVEAMRSAEAALRSALWERFGDDWALRRAFYVPADRLPAELRSWLQREVSRRGTLVPTPIETLETSEGRGYRQAFVVDFASREVRELRRRGSSFVHAVNERFAWRFASMALVWVVLGILGFGVDRATRGWLTGRIAVASLAIGSISTWLLIP